MCLGVVGGIAGWMWHGGGVEREEVGSSVGVWLGVVCGHAGWMRHGEGWKEERSHLEVCIVEF